MQGRRTVPEIWIPNRCVMAALRFVSPHVLIRVAATIERRIANVGEYEKRCRWGNWRRRGGRHFGFGLAFVFGRDAGSHTRLDWG